MGLLAAGRDGSDSERANGAHAHQPPRSFSTHLLGWPFAVIAPAALLLAGLAAVVMFSNPFHSMHPKPVRVQQQILLARPRAVAEWSADVPVWHNQVWPLFIGYTWGWTMLQQTLEAFAASGWPGIVIVDNSRQKDAFKQEKLLREKYNISLVIETPAFLSFSQLQNMFAHLAGKWRKEWYFWAHSDALLIPRVADPYREAVQCVMHKKSIHPNASAVFFSYDHLSALETDTVLNKVPWDPYIQHYYADCDLYGRMIRYGHTIEECSVGMVFNMPILLEPGLANQLKKGNLTYEQQVELVRGAIANEKKGADYAWRNHAADSTSKKSEADKHGFQLHQEASRQYYFKKYWHEAPCDWQTGKQPRFDVTDGR